MVALGEIKLNADAPELVPTLIAALKDTDNYVKRWAARALGEIKPRQTRQNLSSRSLLL